MRLSRARRRDYRARRLFGERQGAAFEDWRRAAGRRLVLLTTKARLAYDQAPRDGTVTVAGRLEGADLSLGF